MTVATTNSGPTNWPPLRQCTFRAVAGEIVGVIGPAGAGKSTLLRMLAGEVAVAAGSATIMGQDVGAESARQLIGYASDPPLLPPQVTGVEWLSYVASHRAQTPAERLGLVRTALEVAELDAGAAVPIAAAPDGVARRLAFASAVMCGRSLILLDETLTGCDATVVRRLRQHLARLAAGRVILITSHDLHTIERLATRVLVLRQGALIADAPTAAVLGERVAEVSLSGTGLLSADWLVTRFPGAQRTGSGAAIPLRQGLTLEQVLSECHAERIPVGGTRVRYRTLEDLLEPPQNSFGSPG